MLILMMRLYWSQVSSNQHGYHPPSGKIWTQDCAGGMFTKVGVKESQITEEAGKEPSPDPSENLDPDQICVLAPCLQSHDNNHVCRPPISVMYSAHCAVYELYFIKVTSVLKKKSRK